MHRGERDNFYNDVSRDFRSVQMAVEYVKALPNPTYHYFNPPSGFDLIDTYDSDDLDDLGSEYFL